MKILKSLSKKLNKPAAATFDEWNDWHQTAKKKYPIIYFVTETLPKTIRITWGRLVWWPLQRYYWAIIHRFHPKHRYHVVNSGLEPGYHDPDTLILYSCMNMLKHFVEVGAPHVEWSATEYHQHGWEEMQAIYKWWNNYLTREDTFPETPKIEGLTGESFILGHKYDHLPEMIAFREAVSKHYEECEQLIQQEEEMLIRLMKIRRLLWYP